MKITNLLAVKNYEAGRDGNLLVAIDEELVAKAYRVNDKTMNICPLICTAYVKNPDDQKRLRKHTDGKTPVDRVIVVSKKFQSLFNKTQLILLEKQNAIEDVTDPDSDVEVQVYAEVAAMAKFGVFRSKMAFHKAQSILEKDEVKVGKKLYSNEKKREKETKKNFRKAAKKQKLGDILEPDDNWKDVDAEEANKEDAKTAPETKANTEAAPEGTPA